MLKHRVFVIVLLTAGVAYGDQHPLSTTAEAGKMGIRSIMIVEYYWADKRRCMEQLFENRPDRPDAYTVDEWMQAAPFMTGGDTIGYWRLDELGACRFEYRRSDGHHQTHYVHTYLITDSANNAEYEIDITSDAVIQFITKYVYNSYSDLVSRQYFCGDIHEPNYQNGKRDHYSLLQYDSNLTDIDRLKRYVKNPAILDTALMVQSARAASRCESFVYVYDALGNMLEETWAQNRDTVSWEYSYDNLGRLREKKLYYGVILSERYSETQIYYYDQEGRPVGRTVFDREGAANFNEEILYNDCSLVSEEIRHKFSSSPVRRLLYSYDPDGKLTEKRVFRDDTLIEKHMWLHDDHGFTQFEFDFIKDSTYSMPREITDAELQEIERFRGSLLYDRLVNAYSSTDTTVRVINHTPQPTISRYILEYYPDK